MNDLVATAGSIGPWAWIVAGLVLLGLELMAPGVFLMWFGIAALLTGGIAFLTDFTWQIDLLIFVVLAIAAVIVGRRTFNRGTGEQPLLNQRAQRLVGTTYVLAEPIVDGQGRVRIDDTMWRISGPDLPAGARVRVAGVDGTLLTVERAG
jgi:membrane protein implicated in regulation of membrane protease activity